MLGLLQLTIKLTLLLLTIRTDPIGRGVEGFHLIRNVFSSVYAYLKLTSALDMFLNQTRTWVLLCVMYMPNGTSASRSIPSHRLRISQGFVGIAFT